MAARANMGGPKNSDVLLTDAEASKDSSTISDDDPSTDRGNWSNKREFVLSVIGYCVGFGNIWRFPYICMKNGGGAFLIPFLLSLILCGLPAFFLELSLGQFLGKSSFDAFCYCPLLKGIGLSMSLANLISTFYYSMILAWSLIYLVNCFKSPLPWTTCGQSWNTPECLTPDDYLIQNENRVLKNGNGSFLGNGTLAEILESMTVDDVNNTVSNHTMLHNNHSLDVGSEITNANVSSTEEFWLRNVLEISSGLDELGGLPWHTTVALVVANLLVLFGIIKGIQSSGKVVYVTATLPYILLTVFFILGLTLEGAGDGGLYYIKPDFTKLMSYEPWMEAAIQVFYSLGPGWGTIITLASYNKFKNNCMRDAIVLTFCCEGTSIFGGFVVFMILGHMAFKSGIHISKYARSGPGLVFVVYPQAISYLPVPQLWGFLFFLMMFSLGLDSMFTAVETIITVLVDLRPKFARKWRMAITIMTVFALTLIGLLYATRGGMYWFQLTDWYVAAFVLLLQGALECVTVSWIYGSDRFSRDIELMIGRKPYTAFIWAWKIVTPSLLIVLWVLTLVFYKPPSYEGYTYPAHAEIIGWTIAVAPFTAVIYTAVKEIVSHSGSLRQRLQLSCVPGKDWVPQSQEAREKYQAIPLESFDVHTVA